MEDFEWPWQYNFPPFFTIQPHNKTREKQLSVWADLVLKFIKHNNQALLDVNEDSPLFHNAELNRKLSAEGRLQVLEALERSRNANPLDRKRRDQWEVYWHTPDEWASIIYRWAQDTGHMNTVCTLYELTDGDYTGDQEFHGLDKAILLKALRVLEERGQATIIQFDDNEGVKFL